jgi:hypothetical protein
MEAARVSRLRSNWQSKRMYGFSSKEHSGNRTCALSWQLCCHLILHAGGIVLSAANLTNCH